MTRCAAVTRDSAILHHTRAAEATAEYEMKGSPGESARCTAIAASTGRRCRQRPLHGRDRCRGHLDPAELLAQLDVDAPDPFELAAELLDPNKERGS